jgi:hydrogenase-4 component F
MLLKTRDIASVRGLAKISPFVSAALFLGSFAIAGAPPFAVFISEFSIFKAGFDAQYYVVTALLVLFIVVAFFGLISQVSQMVFGTPVAPVESTHLPVSCRISLFLGAVPIIVLGVYWPPCLHQLFQQAASALEVLP